MRSVIEVTSGALVDLENPDPNTLSINDIATALSRIARYTGHGRHRFSVAQHSVLASMLARPYMGAPGARLAVLMHDAQEAYLGDVSSPLKRLLPEYEKLEARMQAAIGIRFGIDFRVHDVAIHEADLQMLATEAYHLLPSRGRGPYWGVIAEFDPGDGPLGNWGDDLAAANFLERFYKLGGR
jgi:hypothetical protein